MRNPSSLPLVILACLASFLVGCSDTATEPALRQAVTVGALPPGWTAVDLTTWDSCNEEFVDWTTRRIDRISLKEDGAGGFHFSLHRTWIGTGVGQVTGTEYLLNWPHEVTENVKPPFPYTFSRIIANNLVTKGKAENRIFRLQVHFTVNANGEVTSDFAEQTLKCVG